MSLGLHAYFNYSQNPKLSSPLLLVSNSTMYPPSFFSSSGFNSLLKGAWSPLDSNDSNLEITITLTFATCPNPPLNLDAPLSFIVFTIPYNAPSSFVAPSNVNVL